MLTAFVAWWARQLLELVGLAQATDGARKNALVIESLSSDPATVAVIHRRNGIEGTPLGRYHLDSTDPAVMRRALPLAPCQWPVILRLPFHVLLETEVSLPLLAERDPARVLGYEMDRLTPFSVKEVFWSFFIERGDWDMERLRLRLSLVPRQDVQPLLIVLAQIGLVPCMLEIPVPSGKSRLVKIVQAPQPPVRRLPKILIGVCAILAIVAVVQPFARQSLAFSRTEAELQELGPRIKQVEVLRRRIASQTAGVGLIRVELERVGDAMGVLATITKILPDDAFLTAFSMSQKAITLDGQAIGAARLIALLSAHPTIRNPTFAAPVTRAADGRTEVFSIHAGLGP